MLSVLLPLAGNVEVGITIAPLCSLDQFHDLLHHVMKETTGSTQILGIVLRDTTVGPRVQGKMVGIPVMRESMHLTGQGVRGATVTVRCSVRCHTGKVPLPVNTRV